MFISYSQIRNYADDTTLYVTEQDIEQVIKTLEQDVVITREWLKNNYMKLNEEKCNLINFSKSNINTSLKIDNTTIKPSKEQKLLGISVDKNLSFKGHVESLCKKASQKLHALSRISNYMDDRQVKQTMNVLILSQFSYCPLIWMFCDRQINNRINKFMKSLCVLPMMTMNQTFKLFLKKTTRRLSMIKICSCFLQKCIKLYIISAQVS